MTTLYNGIVKSGIDGVVLEMSSPGSIEEWRILTGLELVPGTLNLQLRQPFDLTKLVYLRFADIGWEFDPATQGNDYDGEIGIYYGRVTIGGKHPGVVCFFTWSRGMPVHAELVSTVHLRTKLDLRHGDTVTFTLDETTPR